MKNKAYTLEDENIKPISKPKIFFKEPSNRNRHIKIHNKTSSYSKF